MWHKCHSDLGPGYGKGPAIAERTKKEWGICFDGKREIFLEKSVVNSARIPWLREFFQPAYFIHIVRNGYAVSEGLRRRTRGLAAEGEYDIGDCAAQWAVSNRTVREALADYPHWMELSYEDLVRDPEASLERIFRFLDLEPTEVGPLASLTVHGKSGPVRDQNPESLARLSPADCDRIEEAAGEELRLRGYARPEGLGG